MWCVLTWHFSDLQTKPSGAQCTRVRACPCLCAKPECECTMYTYMRMFGPFCSLTLSPSYSSFSSQTQITPYVIPQPHRQERNRELLRKVHLVSWQHPNYKIVETPCIERIILNYSELEFKFHFVLALSNGQKLPE